MNGQNGKSEKHMLVEPDIGSGEMTPGQEDTEKIIEQIGPSVQKKSRNDESGADRLNGDKEAGR